MPWGSVSSQVRPFARMSDYELRHGALLRDMTKAMKEVGASNTAPSEIFGWCVLNQFI